MPRTTSVTFDPPKGDPDAFLLFKDESFKEVSKEVKLLFVCCASTGCINHKGSVVHYSHRIAIMIEILQLLADPHLVFCLGMRNNEMIWKRLTCNFL